MHMHCLLKLFTMKSNFNIQLLCYIAMVRSILEYASPEAYCPVWSPYIKQGANKLEIVQRQAAGFIMAQCLFQSC